MDDVEKVAVTAMACIKAAMILERALELPVADREKLTIITTNDEQEAWAVASALRTLAYSAEAIVIQDE